MTKDLLKIEKEFEKMKRQINHLMSGFLSDSFDKSFPFINSFNKNELMNTSFKTPITDIYETKKEVVAKIEVPGIKKEDIKLKVKNGILSLNAEKKQEKVNKDEKKGYHRIESSYSGFFRSFSLPTKVDESKVKAEYKDGILEVHMPKKEDADKGEVKYIDID
ncbi:MAG: Hsp20/alpha crystallin family protein [Nanoarchaeota archaeon]